MFNISSYFIFAATLEEILPKGFVHDIVVAAIRVSIILILGRIAFRISKGIFHSVFLRRKPTERETLTQVFTSGAKYIINFFVICGVLDIFGISVTSILAVAGVGSVAIGFGAQTLIKDVITGIFILVEEQYGVGDDVVLATRSGIVEKIELRTTTLRNHDLDEIYIIPHSTITTVTNKSRPEHTHY